MAKGRDVVSLEDAKRANVAPRITDNQMATERLCPGSDASVWRWPWIQIGRSRSASTEYTIKDSSRGTKLLMFRFFSCVVKAWAVILQSPAARCVPVWHPTVAVSLQGNDHLIDRPSTESDLETRCDSSYRSSPESSVFKAQARFSFVPLRSELTLDRRSGILRNKQWGKT